MIVGAVLAIVSALAGPAESQTNSKRSPSQPSGTIRGFVRDARTNEPIVGANVGIDSRFGAMALKNGTFTITDVHLACTRYKPG